MRGPGRQRRWVRTVPGRATFLVHSAKTHARRSVSKDLRSHVLQLLNMGVCWLCGLPLVFHRRDALLSPSLDRVNPAGHYTPANTQVAHVVCNKMRGDLSPRLMRPHIRRVMLDIYGRILKGKRERS